MTNPQTIAEEYLAVWNEDDGEARRRMLADGWTGDARYVDPLMAGEGHEGVAAMIEAARRQFPGHGFTLRGQPDGHGPFIRFSWRLGAADGASVAGGADVVRLDGAGRIAEVVGFLDG
jgi:hypothetical protein